MSEIGDMQGEKRRRMMAAAALIVIALAGAGMWYHVGSLAAGSDGLEKITVGMEPNQVNSLIIIASDKGFFRSEGLNVTIRGYPSGAAAVNGLLLGECDMATATEFVVVGKALAREPVLTFASIDKFQQIYLIGLKERGIRNISDIKGRKIGVPMRTAAEFYLGRLLTLQGLSMDDVSLIDMKPAQSEDLLANGTADAVVIWQPYVWKIKEDLGNRTVIWPAQSSQAAYCSAVSTDNWTYGHQMSLVKFLRSLSRAESYLIDHPDDGMSTVQKELGYEDAFIRSIWPDHQFSLVLDQSLVLAMEDEGRWMIGNRLTSERTIPNFGKYLYTKGLEEVQPQSVKIIR